jgi:Sulfotransferase family
MRPSTRWTNGTEGRTTTCRSPHVNKALRQNLREICVRLLKAIGMKNHTHRTETLSRRLFALREPKVLYLFIPKCGCTFVKNVLWAIQNGQFHPNPVRIHDDDSAFLRASDLGIDVHSIEMEPMAFTVIRNPIDRLLSLYFDKVVGKGRENYVPLARILIEKRGLNPLPATLSNHQYNIEVLVDWLEENISDEIDLPKDAHWTPQVYRSDIMQTFNLKMLAVDKLTTGLDLLLSPAVQNARHIIGRAEKNSSSKTADKKAVLTREIRRKINSVYAGDRRLYQLVNGAWESSTAAVVGEAEIPRYRELMATAK